MGLYYTCMRLCATMVLLISLVPARGQIDTARRLTLEEALSLALLNNGQLDPDSRKVLLAEVEGTYFNQLYQICCYNTLNEQAYLLRDIERVARLRYEAGDIDLLEKTMMISRLAEIRTTISMLDDDLAITTNRMKLLLLSSEEIFPADSILTLYELRKGIGSGFLPDSAAQRAFENKKENLEFELNKYFKKIQYFHQVALVEADVLLEKNRIRFEKEEIDYAEFVQRADGAYRIQMDYLETVNKYNQTAIQLELYAY